MLVLGLLLIGTVATAAELFTVTGPTYNNVVTTPRTPVVITQNLNTTLIEPGAVACGVAGSYTTQNWYLRRFFLSADHSVVGALTVQGVSIGVEQLQMADASTPPPYDITLKVFTIAHGAAFLFANMTEIGSATVTITDASVGTIINTPLAAGPIVNPVTTDMVVAIDAPDGSAIGAGLQFRPAVNSQGAIEDAYLASADCGVPEPIGVTAIGFPTSQFIFVVYGDEDAGTPVENTSWGAVKALYR